MKTTLFTFAFNFLLISFCHTQFPLVEWDETIGGSASDRLDAACLTTDGGYLLGGHSTSGISGDKTQAAIGGWDYWIVKTNSSGDVEWDKTFGTNEHDYVADVEIANDGGYIIAGYTPGGISGNKTEAAIGGNDYWIIKLDLSGNIIWQNTIGGAGNDYVNSILKVTGGYIISGYSDSGISGDKTESCIGGYDYWILKINNIGNILWQFTYGGDQNDYLVKTIKSTVGQLVLAGYSYSGISGDKSEASIGSTDYWVFSIDGAGSILWQNTIGGAGGETVSDIFEMNSGGYIIAGSSSSNISGDKSEMSLNEFIDCCEPGYGDGWWVNTSDHWFVRINDTGNLIWENTIGTTKHEYISAFYQTDDNRFVAAGTSSSSGSTTNYLTQAIDSLGYPVWSDTYNGMTVYDWEEGFIEQGYSYLNDAIKLADNSLILAGYSDAVAGYDKSEGTVGGTEFEDFWILKLAADTCTPFPVYADYDQDGEGAEYVTSVCQMIEGYTTNNTNDCNDNHSNIYPGNTEICDGIDNDCNGLIDEGLIGCNPGPPVELDFTLGGIGTDYLSRIIPTLTGYIVGGSTRSAAGDLAMLEGESDMIVASLTPSGEIIWVQTLGGTLADYLADINLTSDGGLIVVGYSKSGNTGDKTEASIGGDDLWVIKLDATGNIMWQNSIGGSSNDWAYSIEQTSDGGYIVGARSSSGISGDKTEASVGSMDLWILKLSSLGVIEWQNAIGTSVSDELANIAQTTDGGYIIAASTAGGVSGDKTSPNMGGNDIWILKLNSTGSIVWQRSMGGSEYDTSDKIEQTSGGGYFCSAHSASGISATKSEASINQDMWLIKLGPTGLIIWENTIQAADGEYNSTFFQTLDGGYIIGCGSESASGYDKIEPAILFPYLPYDLNDGGLNDFWILKLNNSGVIEWQNTIGGNLSDVLVDISLSPDGDLILGGYSASLVSADKTAVPSGPFFEIFYEDDPWGEPVYGNLDYWVVRMGYTCVPSAETCNAFDDNCNGLIDEGVIESISISAGGATTFCQGSSVLLTATYSGASIQWKKNGVNIAGATSSTYSVNITGNYSAVTTSPCGTATSSTISVTVNKNPNASISAGGATTFCAGGSVNLIEVPVAACTYQWYKNASLIAGATSTNYIATTAGNYKCRVTKTATGCYKNSNAISVTVPCKEVEGIINEENIFSLYPNPNNGTFSITFASFASLRETEDAILEIYNSIGQLIYAQQINSTDNKFSKTISLDNIPSGIYFVRISNGDNYSQQKLIIQ